MKKPLRRKKKAVNNFCAPPTATESQAFIDKGVDLYQKAFEAGAFFEPIHAKTLGAGASRLPVKSAVDVSLEAFVELKPHVIHAMQGHKYSGELLWEGSMCWCGKPLNGQRLK